jgi:predicted kinase
LSFADSNILASLIPPFTSRSADKKITDHAAEAPKRERRRKLLELAKAKFLDGNVPMPYTELRAVDTKITDDPAEVAKRERRRKLLELAKATFPRIFLFL